MDESRLPADLQRAIDFHGHLCPGIMIGWRAARAAANALGVGKSEDEELVAIVENDSCSVDAFQSMLSTTFGKGNFFWKDLGKQAFTLIDRNQDKAVRVVFTGESLRKKNPDGSIDREAFMQGLLTAPDSEVVKISQVATPPPPEAMIEPPIPCASCGELTQKSKTVEQDGEILCRTCAGEASK